MSEQPLVSILMTAYNREKYIGEAIDSVLASNYQNLELIIVDDCSRDRTPEIARDYVSKDKRVTFHKNANNLGQFANRNKAAAYANGKYLKYFDSDDILYSHSILKMVESMEQFPAAGAGIICYSDEYIGKTPVLFSPRECYFNHYFNGSTFLAVGPSGTIFRKDVFEKMGRFAENSGILSDTLLMLQIAAKMPIVGLEKNLFYWRIHEEQVTEGQKKVFEMLLERHNINQAVLNCSDCPLTKEEIKIVQRNLKNIFIRNLPKLAASMSIKSTLLSLEKFNILPIDFFLAFKKNKRALLNFNEKVENTRYI